MKDLNNKVVVITGAGSGIGRSLALQLGEEGAHLALSDLNADGLRETEALLQSSAGTVITYLVDVADREQVYQYAEQVIQDFGRVDVVINNAGVALSATVEDMSYDDFEWVMNINFWGVVYGSKAFLPHLKQAKHSYLINISSVFGLIGYPTQAAYNASKFAVRGFTEALRQELKDTGVIAMSVHPGGIRTNIVRNARFTSFLGGQSDRQAIESLFDKVALTSADKAAAIIIKGVKKNRERVLVGPDASVFDAVQRLLPSDYDKLIKLYNNTFGKSG